MRILHTADLHVGDSRNLPGYLERQRAMLVWLTRQACDHQVDAFLIAGDIFDTKHILPRERDMFMEWLLDNDRHGLESGYVTYMINGNHDEIDDGYTHLHGLQRLMHRGVLQSTAVVEVHALCLPLRTSNQDELAFIACLPAAGYKQDELSTVVRTFRSSVDLKAEKQGKRVKYFVVMAHESLSGATTETGTYRSRGPTIDTSLDVTYWALGDIHKPYQQMAPAAWYPGSPIQHEFGDVSRQRGALLVDLDDPTNPKPLQVEGVTPLLTVYDWPDTWPEDAIVRFEGTAEEIAGGRFPENVVAFKPLVERQDVSAVTSIDLAGYALLEGLDSLLADQGVPDTRWEAVGDVLRRTLDACR